ncbi:hypothetical protein [Pontibacter mangrovi]|uniref:Uncharacterized protein n=1 Tax=Pontibacter mangrovi TaxID=2589816 RepID=A0A501W5L7_9BACT|nr:hypothetical protein [Pontibacter mangrovi]TPE43374.1 hypothetical protein FJM65_14810 [Pontibacter mangrovi]
MRKVLLTVISVLTLLPCLQAQDLITKRTGEKVEAKVLEINSSEIKYKRFSHPEGPTYVVPKSEVLLITYEDKTSEVFELEEHTATVSSENVPSPVEVYKPTASVGGLNMYVKGQADGRRFYDGHKAAGTTTLIVSLLSPVVGLIPAGITSAVPPKEHNWDAPNNQLLQNPDYKSGYLKSARRKKVGKVFTNWGIGLGANLILALIIIK